MELVSTTTPADVEADSAADLDAPAVRFEPCSSFHDDPASDGGCCAGCGWPLDDHEAALAHAA